MRPRAALLWLGLAFLPSLACQTAHADPAQRVRSFTLKCFEKPGNPANCFEETTPPYPRCAKAVVKRWQAPDANADIDKRLAALPVDKCIMPTDTGLYLCERAKGCGRYHHPEYRATRQER